MRESSQGKKPLLRLRWVGCALGWLIPLLALGLCPSAAAKPRIAVVLSKQKTYYKAAVDGFIKNLDSENKTAVLQKGQEAAVLKEVV
jgi:hypothetical protein